MQEAAAAESAAGAEPDEGTAEGPNGSQAPALQEIQGLLEQACYLEYTKPCFLEAVQQSRLGRGLFAPEPCSCVVESGAPAVCTVVAINHVHSILLTAHTRSCLCLLAQIAGVADRL